jgi:SAM-dependent methyltransferase
MALIAYDEQDAAAFSATRDHTGHTWHAAVRRHFDPVPGQRLVDLGSGTGFWARAFTRWFPGLDVVAVEPSAAMRSRSVFTPVAAGSAAEIPLDDATADAVWLSTVIHHVPSLPAAAREIHRVLRPGGRVLVRSAFAGRHAGITLFRYFPEAVDVLAGYPSVAAVEAAFTGFTTTGFEAVPQTSAASLSTAVRDLDRAAHTPLQLISDAAYAAGVERMRVAALTASGPVVDLLDLLVLRKVSGGGSSVEPDLDALEAP